MLVHIVHSGESQFSLLRLGSSDVSIADFRKLGRRLEERGITFFEKTDEGSGFIEFSFRIGGCVSVSNHSDANQREKPALDRVSKSRHGRPAALTKTDVALVEELLEEGKHLRDIAYAMGCSVRTIRRVGDGTHIYSSRESP